FALGHGLVTTVSVCKLVGRVFFVLRLALFVGLANGVGALVLSLFDLVAAGGVFWFSVLF
ncbi:hypothetical protein, partial [Pectobacterium brasiliense]|uniref:hypothetical protein n=1 Tax=Pectobacterium brasiliense TaxID=180957 RepID=UPI001968EF7A